MRYPYKVCVRLEGSDGSFNMAVFNVTDEDLAFLRLMASTFAHVPAIRVPQMHVSVLKVRN